MDSYSLGRSILGRIARDIAGDNPYVSATISRYFIGAQDHPVVKEFLENIAKLGKIGTEDKEIGNAVLYDDIMIDGSEYAITTVWKYMQRLLIWPSRHDDFTNYFNSHYGSGNWLLKYIHAPNSAIWSQQKIVAIWNHALWVEDETTSKIVIEWSDWESITIYHPNRGNDPIDLTTKRRLDRLFIPLRRMSEWSTDKPADETDFRVRKDAPKLGSPPHDRNKMKISQICTEIHALLNQMDPISLNVDMMASLDMTGMTSEQRAPFTRILYQVLGAARLRWTIRSIQGAISSQGTLIQVELMTIDAEIQIAQQILDSISDWSYVIVESESLSDANQKRGIMEILREKMRMKMGKLLELRKYLVEE